MLQVQKLVSSLDIYIGGHGCGSFNTQVEVGERKNIGMESESYMMLRLLEQVWWFGRHLGAQVCSELLGIFPLLVNGCGVIPNSGERNPLS